MKKHPSQPNTSTEARLPQQEYLEKVHGYTEPPSVWELGQLAAMLGGSMVRSASQQPWLAQDLVEEAARIWEAAVMKQREMRKRLDDTLGNFESRSILYGPLKVGVHLMPRIDWEKEPEVIPFKRFLVHVVGLAREEDRLLWWRSYLKAKIRRYRHRDRWGPFHTEEARSHPEWREPDDFPIDAKLVPDAIALQREEGFQKGFPASHYAEGFRLWRLEMKTPTQRAAEAMTVEECSKKALEGK